MIKILHISPNFNYSCGISKYLTLLFRALQKYSEYEIHFITNGGDSISRLTDYNIRFQLMNFSTGIKNLFYIKNFKRQLNDYIISNKIDIVHSHHRFADFIISQIKKNLLIKSIITVHSIVKGLESLSYHSDKILAVSKSVEQNLIQIFSIQKEKIIQLYNPIDKNSELLDVNDAKAKLGFDRETKTLLFIGRICKEKGFDILVKSFNELHEKKLKLIVVGKWIDLNPSIILENDNIIYYQYQSDISLFFNAADIVVLPSRVDPFPFTMLETGLYKKPLIASAVDGIAEFVKDNFSGLFFEIGDYKSLTAKIRSLIHDQDKQKYLADNLHKKVLLLDTPEEYCYKLDKIYRELISGSF